MNQKSTEWKNISQNKPGRWWINLPILLNVISCKNLTHRFVPLFFFFFEASAVFYWCSTDVCISVYTWYILPWSFLVNCLPIKRILEKIILRVRGLECSPTKMIAGMKRNLAWTNSQMQSNLLWSLIYKLKTPFLPFLCPFFKLYSPFSFLQRGKTLKEKTAAAARVTTYLHSTRSQLPLQWGHYCFS